MSTRLINTMKRMEGGIKNFPDEGPEGHSTGLVSTMCNVGLDQ